MIFKIHNYYLCSFVSAFRCFREIDVNMALVLIWFSAGRVLISLSTWLSVLLSYGIFCRKWTSFQHRIQQYKQIKNIKSNNIPYQHDASERLSMSCTQSVDLVGLKTWNFYQRKQSAVMLYDLHIEQYKTTKSSPYIASLNVKQGFTVDVAFSQIMLHSFSISIYKCVYSVQHCFEQSSSGLLYPIRPKNVFHCVRSTAPNYLISCNSHVHTYYNGSILR